MSLYGALDKTKHLSEFNEALDTASGVITAAVRKARAMANLGGNVQAAPQTATDTATLTAAQIRGGILVGTPTAAAAYTLPLGSSLETSLLATYGDLLVNDFSFDLTVINVATSATFDITMTTNTGWTLVGRMLVDANEATQVGASEAVFRIRRTAANTYTMYRVG